MVDNCEHVIEDVADLLDELLGRCPQLRVLATSRESLEIDGEHTWKVPSLATGAGSAGVELFVGRATAAGAVIATDPATLATVGDIVERLDGIPLAIELAAARARSIDLSELRDRLDDRFRFLSGGKRRSRQRQATLEAAVQWSFDLLNDDERSMLQCLSVFQGGFGLADAAAVAGVGNHVAVDLVDALTAKSLIDVTRDDHGQIRHRLLETIRLFALSRLVDAGEVVAVRDRHLEHFLNDRIGATMNDSYDVRARWRMHREFDNFRSAATWALERGRPDATVRLAAMTAAGVPTRRTADRVRVAPAPRRAARPRPRVRAHGSRLRAGVDRRRRACAARANEAIVEGREHPCDALVGALLTLNTIESIRGNHELAQAILTEARTMAESFGANVRAVAEICWMDSCMERGRSEEALAVAVAICDQAPTLGLRYWAEACKRRCWCCSTASTKPNVSWMPSARCRRPRPGRTCRTSRSTWSWSTPTGPTSPLARSPCWRRRRPPRRPAVFVDFLLGFAYAAYLRGERDRAREIAFNILPLGAGWVQTWLVNQLHGTSTDLDQIRREFDAEHPWNDLRTFTDEHGPRLFAEELARWSSEDSDAVEHAARHTRGHRRSS